MNNVGYFVLILATVIAVASVVIFYVRSRQGGSPETNMKLPYQTVYAIFGAITVASLVLLYGFITNDFTFDYVASNSSADMSLFYRISAFWAGQEGSFLLWLWFLSAAAAAIAYFRSTVYDKLTSDALMILGIVQAVMLSYLLVLGNPFKLAVQAVGQGMNPMLMHWAMVLHPPTLFVGYALVTIPFAYALAALIGRDSSSAWVERSQRWTLVGWLFLGLGIFLGAAWAYVVLGWGGYWGWDPVENASLLPWIGVTALLHSFHIYKQRNNFKRWALSMSVFAFFMVIMAAFMTRSGQIQSVHSFEGSQAILAYFAAAIIATLGAGIYLLKTRWEEFKSEEIFESFLSRDAFYHINNLILIFCAGVILFGAFLPLAINKSVGIATYAQIAQPLGIVFLLIISICPLLSFKETDPKKLARKLAIPATAALLSAYPWFVYWKSLEKLVTSVNASQPLPANGWVGYLGFLVATFGAAAAIQAMIDKIKLRAKGSNTSITRAIGDYMIKTPGQAGGFVAHLGMSILVMGLVGSSMYVATLPKAISDKAGTSFKAGEIKFTYNGLKESEAKGKQIAATTFTVVDEGGTKLRNMEPKYVYYLTRQQPGMNADVIIQPFRDIFLVFQGINEKNELLFEVKINPLISFVWAGSIMLILGSIISVIPKRHTALKGSANGKR